MDRQRVVDVLAAVVASVAVSTWASRAQPSMPPASPSMVAAPKEATSVVAKPAGSWLGDNIAWVLGLLPFVAAILRVYIFSGGDQAILVAILSELNITSLVLTGVVHSLPIVVVTLGSYYAIKMQARNILKFVVICSTFGLAACMLAPVTELWGAASISIVVPILVFVTARDARRKNMKYPAEVWLISLTFTVIVSSSVSGNADWIRTEQIEVADEASRVAFVVDEQDDALVVVWDGRGVERVLTDDIRQRAICTRDRDSRLTYEVLTRKAEAGSGTVRCDPDS